MCSVQIYPDIADVCGNLNQSDLGSHGTRYTRDFEKHQENLYVGNGQNQPNL